MKRIFWPIINHGDPSLYATLTSECVGQQDPEAFWQVHDLLFENQSDLWRADRDYFVQTAVAVGVDQASFEACYDNPDSLAHILNLDDIRRQWGIFSQPTFDVNGRIFSGAQPFSVFEEVIEEALP